MILIRLIQRNTVDRTEQDTHYSLYIKLLQLHKETPK